MPNQGKIAIESYIASIFPILQVARANLLQLKTSIQFFFPQTLATNIDMNYTITSTTEKALFS